MSKPLLELVMMVKNEADNIAAVIESIRPYIDRWTILDTGSTDGTLKKIHEAVGTVPGDLFCEPFVDYGQTRSRLLDLAGTQSTFAIMLNGEEEVVNGAALRQFC